MFLVKEFIFEDKVYKLFLVLYRVEIVKIYK